VELTIKPASRQSRSDTHPTGPPHDQHYCPPHFVVPLYRPLYRISGRSRLRQGFVPRTLFSALCRSTLSLTLSNSGRSRLRRDIVLPTLSFHFVEFPALPPFARTLSPALSRLQPIDFSQNPNGIPQQSPGLRGTSVRKANSVPVVLVSPGRKFGTTTTLKGLWPTARQRQHD